MCLPAPKTLAKAEELISEVERKPRYCEFAISAEVNHKPGPALAAFRRGCVPPGYFHRAEPAQLAGRDFGEKLVRELMRGVLVETCHRARKRSDRGTP